METVSTIAQVLIGIGTLLISIFLLIHEYRGRRVSTQEQVNHAFNEISALGLSSEENLRALAKVLYPTKTNKLDALRQRLFSYLVLNATELTFIAETQKSIKRKTAYFIVEDLLRSTLQNKEAWNIIETGTYDSRFTQLAQKVKQELDTHKKGRKK